MARSLLVASLAVMLALAGCARHASIVAEPACIVPDEQPENAITPQEEPIMPERKAAVTFKGQPLTLLGKELRVGDDAPGFALVANDLSAVDKSICAGKVCIISTVPSLDTPVCSTETRRFNQEAANLGPDVKVITVSMDLPFAQKRWCAAEGIENVVTLSDYRDASFATAYGVLIKELHLLARCIFVVDKEGRIQYIQLVKEVSSEPDYDPVLAAARKLAS